MVKLLDIVFADSNGDVRILTGSSEIAVSVQLQYKYC